MIKNIIFDFDGVIVDSEVIVGRSVCQYLLKRGINFEEKDFFKLAGNKTVQVISELSSRFNIEDEKSFYDDIMSIAQDYYLNNLKEVKGIKDFLQNTNHKRLIGSNNIKERIIDGLERLELINFFKKDLIYSFDLVGSAKPEPDIYLRALEDSEIDPEKTIIIEDSSIGVKSGVSAGLKVIGITAGGHWYKNRNNEELYDAGAYEVVNDYKDMLLLINKL